MAAYPPCIDSDIQQLVQTLQSGAGAAAGFVVSFPVTTPLPWSPLPVHSQIVGTLPAAFLAGRLQHVAAYPPRILLENAATADLGLNTVTCSQPVNICYTSSNKEQLSLDLLKTRVWLGRMGRTQAPARALPAPARRWAAMWC